jgi:predicted anti-sigma-YlaC factor YlaD
MPLIAGIVALFSGMASAVWPAIAAGLTWLFSAFLSRAVLVVLALMFKDVIFGVISDVLGMAVNAINSTGVDLPTLSEVTALLPSEALVVLKRVGLDTCMQLIVSAYTIRGSLKLFSFVGALKPRATS